MFKRPRITDAAYDPSRFGGSHRAAHAAYLLDEERYRVRSLLARWLIAGAAVVAALLVAGFVLAGCSSPDEFSQCVKRCTGARDPLPGGECVRLCEHLLAGGEHEATEGSER